MSYLLIGYYQKIIDLSMARVHFVTAHFGGEAPFVNEVISKKHEVSLSYYTDKNFPSRHLSMHPRMKAKIPKMLEWKFINSEWYIWMDSSVRLKEKDPVDKILEYVGNNQLCLFKHSYGNTIEFEAKRVLQDLKNKKEYISRRYSGEPIKEQLSHYLNDPNFNDENLFGMTFFVYNKSLSNLMEEWFMQNMIWSLEDQISFPYVLYKSKVKYSLFQGFIDGKNDIFDWDWKSREINLQ